MATGKKISQLPAITSCALTDIIPDVQPASGGVTYKATLTQVRNLYQATPWPATAGGTGVASPASHTLPVANGASAFSFLGPLTSGQFLVGSTGALPVAGTITAGANIAVTPGAGTLAVGFTNGGQIVGTATNDNAAAGNIGEFMSSNVPVGSAIALVSGAQTTLTFVTLTPGDWDVTAFMINVPGAGTVTTALVAGISAVAATLPTPSPNNGYGGGTNAAGNADETIVVNLAPCRISIAVPTAFYLIAYSVFSVSTQTVYGWISARRAR